MSYTWFIAKRYFFTRRKQHAVNIITWITVVGIMTGTAGLVIVLSVFNGFSTLVNSMYDAFDPDLKITPVSGKFFQISDLDTVALRQIKGVKAFSFTLRENVLVKFNDRQSIAVLIGADRNFNEVSKVNDFVIDGKWRIENQSNDALIGAGLAYNLGITPDDLFHNLQFYYPDKDADINLSPADAFRIDRAKAAAVFSIQQEFDISYILSSLAFVQELTHNESKVSDLQVAAESASDINQIKSEISSLLANRFDVKNRKEQHSYLLKIFKSEKFAIYLILGFILVLSSFGIIGSLSMLMIEKRDDIQTLFDLGAEVSSVRKIFIMNGLLLTSAGLLSGIFIGILICKFQEYFGLIKLGKEGDFVINAYPVSVQVPDLLLIGFIVLSLGSLLSTYIVNKMVLSE
ncbi:MAG: ABC transporter permease [Bacteroidia bacterium]|nr:ABC transporter permease [Bacteroidia bacterium]